MAKLGKELGKSYATIFALGGIVELKKKKKRKKDANRNNK
jgi:hypothetical protein